MVVRMLVGCSSGGRSNGGSSSDRIEMEERVDRILTTELLLLLLLTEKRWPTSARWMAGWALLGKGDHFGAVNGTGLRSVVALSANTTAPTDGHVRDMLWLIVVAVVQRRLAGVRVVAHG